ncbi:MAG: hypothetical protein KG012_06245 [Deltaproteobacteria bacterium]|nr:hypothetical protein [Deltaproteobacteria bacterium]
MPQREKDRVLARRRKRKKERAKLRKKGLLAPFTPKEAVKEVAKKPEKTPAKEAPKTDSGPTTPAG